MTEDESIFNKEALCADYLTAEGHNYKKKGFLIKNKDLVTRNT